MDTTCEQTLLPTGVGEYARSIREALLFKKNLKVISISNISRKEKSSRSYVVRLWPFKRLIYPLISAIVAPDFNLRVDGHHSRLSRGLKIQVIHDLTFLSMPELYDDSDLSSQVASLRLALHNTDAFITVSYSTKKKLKALTNKPIFVLYPYVKLITQASKEGIISVDQTDSFFLVIGNNHPRKRIQELVNFFNFRIERLVVIGGFYARGEVSSNISIKGYVSEEEKARLLAKCRTVIIPSADEGFGIPVMESLLAGKRPICRRIDVLQEVSLGLGLYYDSEKHELDSLLKNSFEVDRAYVRGLYEAARATQLSTLNELFN
jgi:glycosyltransferase involved in cell wall biosynthesis